MPELPRNVRAAVSFLTAIPVGRGIGGRDLGRGAVLFPIVGAAIGGLVALVSWGAMHLVPAFAAGVLGVATGVAVTGALHLDGLGDVADGVGAALSGSDPVEAMRDPCLGTFGIAAVTLDLLLRVSLLSTLVVDGFPWPVVAAGALSRAAPVLLAWLLPYVGSGTGGWTERIDRRVAAIATALALLIAFPSAAPPPTVVMVLLTTAATSALGSWSRRRLGGITGDVLGATAEIGETLALGAAVAVG